MGPHGGGNNGGLENTLKSNNWGVGTNGVGVGNQNTKRLWRTT